MSGYSRTCTPLSETASLKSKRVAEAAFASLSLSLAKIPVSPYWYIRGATPRCRIRPGVLPAVGAHAGRRRGWRRCASGTFGSFESFETLEPSAPRHWNRTRPVRSSGPCCRGDVRMSDSGCGQSLPTRVRRCQIVPMGRDRVRAIVSSGSGWTPGLTGLRYEPARREQQIGRSLIPRIKLRHVS